MRPLHNRVKIAIFCHVWNNNLANSSTMTLGSTILNQEVHENGVEMVILGCQKADNILKMLAKRPLLWYTSLKE